MIYELVSEHCRQSRMTHDRLDYRDKMILAPMVKIGTLPFRLLALQYGADIVYTEEIIDKRLLASERLDNPVLGTVDYIDRRDNSLVFRTCAREKPKLGDETILDSSEMINFSCNMDTFTFQ